MQAVIISDVHLGSPYCRCGHFREFLDALPDGLLLILNGDTLDNPRLPLAPPHQAAYDQLIASAARLRIVWVEGNHDLGFRPPDPLTVCAHYELQHRLLVAHGHDFDEVMPQHRWFIRFFHAFHRLRMRCGAPAVHVADYAKKWAWLYQVLRRRVCRRAVERAADAGFAAVACGHVHYAENNADGQVRYFNTGSWTERPTYCVVVDEAQIDLLQTTELIERRR